MRPDSVLVVGLNKFHEESGNQAPGQRVAERQNLKVIMLNLALQMLANGIEITEEQIIKLKYVVVSSLGFTNCKLEARGGGGGIDVVGGASGFGNAGGSSGTGIGGGNGTLHLSYGELVYSPDDFTQNMVMISCLGNLKKVLDRPIYLKNSNGTNYFNNYNNSGTIEETNLEEDLAGGYFVDVVFSLINSSVDMSMLSHLMFKIWIELLLIIVYKVIIYLILHNIMYYICTI